MLPKPNPAIDATSLFLAHPWVDETSDQVWPKFIQKRFASGDSELAFVRSVYTSAGFELLTESQKLQVLALIGGKNPTHAIPAQAALTKMTYLTLKPADQSAALLKILDTNALETLSAGTPTPYQHYMGVPFYKFAQLTVAGPTADFTWPAGENYAKSAAARYDLTLNYSSGKTISKAVYFDNKIIAKIDVTAFLKTFAHLPLKYAETVPSFRISNFGSAGLTGGDGVIDLNSTNSPDTTQPVRGNHRVISHESGHSVWFLKGSKHIALKDWDSAYKKDGVYPSPYGSAWSEREHIAEISVVYTNVIQGNFADEYLSLFFYQLQLFEKIFQK